MGSRKSTTFACGLRDLFRRDAGGCGGSGRRCLLPHLWAQCARGMPTPLGRYIEDGRVSYVPLPMVGTRVGQERRTSQFGSVLVRAPTAIVAGVVPRDAPVDSTTRS